MKKPRNLLLLTLLGIAPAAPLHALDFNFIHDPDIDPAALAGFVQAGSRWSSLFRDNVTINIVIGFEELDPDVLGNSGSAAVPNVSYQEYRALLQADATSGADAIAVANLPADKMRALLNRVDENGRSATPYLDDNDSFNNHNLFTQTAVAKAVGAIDPHDAGIDAGIGFNSLVDWDFDASDGIDSLAYDFVGTATHELGHALGFVSGVDYLDQLASLDESGEPGGPFAFEDDAGWMNSLDLFRFSAMSREESANLGLPVMDWTADDREKFFSIDGGQTFLAPFSTGVNYGDGSQASHWKDGLFVGMMGPTLDVGQIMDISELDLRALDVIGWDLIAAVPEDGSVWSGVLFAALIAGHIMQRSRDRRPVSLTL